MLTLKNRFGFVAGIASVFCLIMVAGCNSDTSATKTDKEAAENAAKISTQTAPPAGSTKQGMAPPPP